MRELEFVTEEAELVSHRVKPNYRTLGPRFGKSMPQVAAAVEGLDPDSARAAANGERQVGISIDGHEHTLEPDDLQLVMEPLEGYEVESEAGRAVALALDLDDDLRREGLAREVVHAVQNARKEAGLEITDRITLHLGGDKELVEAARAHEEYVTGRGAGHPGRLRAEGTSQRGRNRGQDALDRGRPRLTRGVCCFSRERGKGKREQGKNRSRRGDCGVRMPRGHSEGR